MKKSLIYLPKINITGWSDSKLAQGEKSDCVVRAFASAFGCHYDFAHQFISERFQRKPRRGTFSTIEKLNGLVDEGFTLLEKGIFRVGQTKSGHLKYVVTVRGKAIQRNMTVGKFAELNPTGTYFLLVRGHAFTLKNGAVIGNPEDAQRLRRPVRVAFEIR